MRDGEPPSSVAVDPRLTAGGASIELRQVKRRFSSGDGAVPALAGIDLSIPAGALCSVVGPSGSGKSTLLNVLGLLDLPTEGRYMLNGIDMAALSSAQRATLRNRSIGFVFQHFRLLPWLNVLENVCLPSVFGRMDENALRARATELLDRVGLTHRLRHGPEQLSGGERQRVAIARALVGQPSLLLADEPTGALDSHSGEQVMSLLFDLHAESGATVVLITHDQALARRCPLRVHMRDGRIDELDT